MPNRKKRVVIYGATELVPQVAGFVTRLADALLQKEDIFLATGGFKGKSDDRSGLVSTDISVRDGARDFASRTGESLASCLETWLPEPTKDRVDVDPNRFHEGKIQELQGFSAQARRVKLVQSADAMVTVHGVVRTMLMLEMALVIGRPAVPLPFTGGDSSDHWRDNRPHYLARLGLSENQASAWETFRLGDKAAESILIDDVVGVVNRVVGRKCLILMPFSESDAELAQVIDEQGFHPIRLDRDLFTGDVRQTVQHLLDECDAIIADVTKLSANVMYEIGLAHAQNQKPLLIWRSDPERLEKDLPFYLRPQRIVTSKDQEGIRGAIVEYLQAIKSGSSTGPRT